MKKLLLTLVLLLVPATSFAQNGWLDLNGTPMLLSKTGYNLTVGNAAASSSLKLQGTTITMQNPSNTPFASVNSSGLSFSSVTSGVTLGAASVVTPTANLTPVAGARIATNNFLIVATAAPTANFVFAQPTASVGKTYHVYNQSANPVAILPEDGAINAAAALTPFACAATKLCSCRGFTTGQMICVAQ